MQIKTLALALAAALTVSAPALADDYHVSGELGASFGADFSSFNDFGSEPSGTAFLFSGEGKANVWIAPDMTIQIDATGEGTTTIRQCTCSRDSDGHADGLVGAHLSWRNPDDHLIGFFGGFSTNANLDYDGTFTQAILGVEGQYYSGPFTLYVQGGWEPLMSNSDDFEPTNLGFGRVVGRYFWTENDRLQGEFAYATSGINQKSGSYSIYKWGASWEHRYDGTPFSAGVEYNGFRINGPDGWAVEHVVEATLKLHFGDDTLQAQDRQGATLDIPNFNRATAWAWWLGNEDF
jgi:hypothetical protein